MEIPSKIKAKQIIFVSGLMLAVFVGAKLLLEVFSKEDQLAISQQQTKKMQLPNAGNADLQSLWVQELEGKNKQLSEKLKSVLSDVERQRTESTELKEQVAKATEDFSRKLEQQNMLLQKVQSPESSVSDPFVSSNPQSKAGGDPFSSNGFGNGVQAQAMSSIVSHNLKLIDSKKLKHRRENYIPAGSFVDAVILGGIDAAAGVSSQSEPRPVLLRLIDLSVLPNKIRTDIRDCHVIAAGFGDISSERAYIRTERLSCTLINGDILEEKIEAYITGEDGKDGVRGTVVRREADLIVNSFLAGTLSGIGKGMSQAFGTTSISPLGSTKTSTGSEIFKSGLYGGAGEGGDQLQKYFIQRAEQMHPVIQISAGRTVTLVFLKGVELNVSNIHAP